MKDFKQLLIVRQFDFEEFEQKWQSVEDHVWEVFDKYIKDFKINFNGPEKWEKNSKGICVSGEDGCRGCYEPMSLTIPYGFFVDYDEASAFKLQEMRQKTKEEVSRDIERKKAEIERLNQQIANLS